MDEGSGSTAVDSIGNADGTITGATWISGTWFGGHAIDGDGTDDYVSVGQLGPFGSDMASDFTVAVTISATADGYVLGAINNGDSTSLYAPRLNGGQLVFWMRDASGDDIRVTTDSMTFDDGSTYRVVLVKSGNSASDLSIWVNGSEEPVTETTDNPFSNPSNFDVDVPWLARNLGGSISGNLDAFIDNPILADAAWSSQDISDDYGNQPWS